MKHSKTVYKELCAKCSSGVCCSEGVEMDIEQAKTITAILLKSKFKLAQPWFYHLSPDDDFPSGWSLATVVKGGRCVFQDENFRCLIYNIRPLHCRDFPYEGGRIFRRLKHVCPDAHKFYHRLSRDKKPK